MDIFVRLLARMAYWAHRPPSRQFVIAAALAVAAALAIAGIEYLVGWPEFLRITPLPRTPLR